MRLQWSAWRDPVSTPDVRQRVAARITAEAPRQTFRFGYRWATALAAAVLVPIAIVVTQGVRTPSDSGSGQGIVAPPSHPIVIVAPDFTKALPAGLVTDAVGGDLNVDDPVGAGVDHVLGTSDSAGGVGNN